MAEGCRRSELRLHVQIAHHRKQLGRQNEVKTPLHNNAQFYFFFMCIFATAFISVYSFRNSHFSSGLILWYFFFKLEYSLFLNSLFREEFWILYTSLFKVIHSKFDFVIFF